MHDYIMKSLVDAHIDEVRRAAGRAQYPKAVLDAGRHPQASTDAVTIRMASAADQPELKRLAALDSAELPPDPVALAEVTGELRAAMSLSTGTAIADPFHRTAAIVELLAEWAAQPRGDGRRRWRAWQRGWAMLRGWRREIRLVGSSHADFGNDASIQKLAPGSTKPS